MLVKEKDLAAVAKLWRASMPVVLSQFRQEVDSAVESCIPSNYLLRAVLDIVASGVATDPEEIERFSSVYLFCDLIFL